MCRGIWNSAPGRDKSIPKLAVEKGNHQIQTFVFHLELVVVSILLDLDTLGILPPGFQEEVLDLLDLPGHLEAKVL